MCVLTDSIRLVGSDFAPTLRVFLSVVTRLAIFELVQAAQKHAPHVWHECTTYRNGVGRPTIDSPPVSRDPDLPGEHGELRRWKQRCHDRAHWQGRRLAEP